MSLIFPVDGQPVCTREPPAGSLLQVSSFVQVFIAESVSSLLTLSRGDIQLIAPVVQCRSGEDHRSMTDVLQDLQVQLKGQEPKLLPGQTQSLPLHVVLQVQTCMHARLSHLLSPSACDWRPSSGDGDCCLGRNSPSPCTASHADVLALPASCPASIRVSLFHTSGQASERLG